MTPIHKFAKVLALVNKSPSGQREDVLQVTTYGQQLWCIQRKRNAKRNKSACAANELRSAINDCRNGIVASLQDLAVMHQKGVGDVA